MALIDNILSYWKFEDLTDSHGSNDLTNSGAGTGVSGKILNCFDFENDDSDYCDTSLSFPSGDFSVSCWIYYETPGNYDKPACIDKSEAGSLSLFAVERNTSNYWTFYVVNTTNSQYVATANSTLSTGVWTHIVGTYNNTTKAVTLYINGSAQTSTGTLSGTRATPTGNFTIGAGFYNSSRGNYFDGLIDEMGLWSKVLSSEEVTSLYNSGDGFTYPFSVGPTTPTTTGVSSMTGISTITM